MTQALKQAWWAPAAGLLVLALLAVAMMSGFSEGENAESRVAGAVIALTGAVVLAAGLWKRPAARRLGNGLIVIGSLLAAWWIWTLVLPVLAIIVVLGLASSEVRLRAGATQTP